MTFMAGSKPYGECEEALARARGYLRAKNDVIKGLAAELEAARSRIRSQSDQRLIEVYRDLEYTVRMILDGPAYDDNEGMLRVALEKLDGAKGK